MVYGSFSLRGLQSTFILLYFIWVIFMEVKFENGNTILYNVTDFDLKQTFMCGQCFRWDSAQDGSYNGVAFGKSLKISTDGKKFVLHNTIAEAYFNVLVKYLHRSRDYGEIKKSLSIHPVMKNATKLGGGIRILRQDIWETTISFIISASNNIPRIKKIILSLCENFGDQLGERVYSFPTPQQLKGVTVDALAPIRAGFRAKYIEDAVKKQISGEIDLYSLENMDTISARNELLKISGIGNKVADCILLFALGRMEVFPVDVWINNTMQGLYPDKCNSISDVRRVGPEIFGNYCGVAQQYLFYYARENGGKVESK